MISRAVMEASPVDVGSDELPVPGELRNRLLRSVDWRLLLPTPEPARVAVFENGHVSDSAAAMRLIADELVLQSAEPGAAHFDLVLVGEPRASVLQRAHEMLRPGGSLQIELRRTGARRIHRVRQRLQAAGFELFAMYSPLPTHPGVPAVWLPLRASGALSYVMSTRPRGRSLQGRIARAVHRLAWQLRGRALLTNPVVMLARKSHGATHDPSTHTPPPKRERIPEDGAGADADLLSRIRAEVTALALGIPADECSLLLLTPGKQSINKVVGLVFREPERRPRLVVKMPRIPEAIPGLRNEAHALRMIHAMGESAPSGVPKILFSFSHGELPVVGESYASGRPLSSLLKPQSAQWLANKATDWLIALARCGSSASPRHPERLLAAMLEDFSVQFGPVVDRALLRMAEDLLGTLGVMPVTVEQRDFSPWNLRVTDAGDLEVLDWESAVLEGLPLLDLIYFLTYQAFYLDRAAHAEQYLRSFRAAADPNTATGSIRAECIAKYAASVGLPASALAPLRVLVWMIHARSEFRQLSRNLQTPPGAAALRESLFVRLWEEELRSL